MQTKEEREKPLNALFSEFSKNWRGLVMRKFPGHSQDTWKVDETTGYRRADWQDEEVSHGLRVTSGDLMVAEVFGIYNARLIAAAPELLAALEAIIAETPNVIPGDMIFRSIVQGRDAIDKATRGNNE